MQVVEWVFGKRLTPQEKLRKVSEIYWYCYCYWYKIFEVIGITFDRMTSTMTGNATGKIIGSAIGKVTCRYWS